MPTIRNTSARDLEVAGRVFLAGSETDVGDGEAEYLLTNPNFEDVAAPPAPVEPVPEPQPEPEPTPEPEPEPAPAPVESYEGN